MFVDGRELKVWSVEVSYQRQRKTQCSGTPDVCGVWEYRMDVVCRFYSSCHYFRSDKYIGIFFILLHSISIYFLLYRFAMEQKTASWLKSSPCLPCPPSRWTQQKQELIYISRGDGQVGHCFSLLSTCSWSRWATYVHCPPVTRICDFWRNS